MNTCRLLVALVVLCPGQHSMLAQENRPGPTVTTMPQFNADVYLKLAVIVENRSEVRIAPGIERSVEDAFMADVLSKGYTLAARSDLERVLAELRLQSRSGITEEAVARAGKVLGVNGIVIVTVNQIATETYEPRFLREVGRQYLRAAVEVSARLVDVENSQIAWISRHLVRANLSGRSQGVELVPSVATVVASGFPRRNPKSVLSAPSNDGSLRVGSVSGIWSGTLSGPQGAFPTTWELIQRGVTISGSFSVSTPGGVGKGAVQGVVTPGGDLAIAGLVGRGGYPAPYGKCTQEGSGVFRVEQLTGNKMQLSGAFAVTHGEACMPANVTTNGILTLAR